MTRKQKAQAPKKTTTPSVVNVSPPPPSKRGGAGKPKNQCVSWSSEDNKVLIEGLLEQKKKFGRMGDNGFKAEAFSAVVDELAPLPNNGVPKKTVHVKSQYHKLKGDYQIVKAFHSCSGLGWNPDLCVVEGPDSVMDDYIQAHPKAKPFRNKNFPLYDLIAELVDSIVATGDDAVTGGVDRASDDENEIEKDAQDLDIDEDGEEEFVDQEKKDGRREAKIEKPKQKTPPPQRQRQSMAGSINNFSRSIDGLARVFHDTPFDSIGTSSDPDSTPKRKKRAINLLEEENSSATNDSDDEKASGYSENDCFDMDDIIALADLFGHDHNKVDTYLALTSRERRQTICKKWLKAL